VHNAQDAGIQNKPRAPNENGNDLRVSLLIISLLIKGILPVIPPRTDRKQPIDCDFKRYKDRNRIERIFDRLKQRRRIATRYGKTAKSYLAFLSLAAARL
jgi:hypothetical protein